MVWVHALGNVWVQLVTVIALTFGSLLEGAVLTETVFAWPGLGLYMKNSLFNADLNAVLGGTMVVGVVYIGLNMLSDLHLPAGRSARTRDERGGLPHGAPTGWRGWLLDPAPASRRQARLGRWYRAWLGFCRNRLAMTGLGHRAAAGADGDLRAAVRRSQRRHRADAGRTGCSRASWAHPFGTDELGRDIYRPRRLRHAASR